jgi:hypothetical protein
MARNGRGFVPCVDVALVADAIPESVAGKSPVKGGLAE